VKVGDLVKIRHLRVKKFKEFIEHCEKTNVLEIVTLEDIKVLKTRCIQRQYGIIMSTIKDNLDLIEVFVDGDKRIINVKNILEVIK